jgi:hypothetical protein
MKEIITRFIYPPIPIRTCDWVAYYEGREEGPTGWGETEQDAIETLKEIAEEDD